MSGFFYCLLYNCILFSLILTESLCLQKDRIQKQETKGKLQSSPITLHCRGQHKGQGSTQPADLCLFVLCLVRSGLCLVFTSEDNWTIIVIREKFEAIRMEGTVSLTG